MEVPEGHLHDRVVEYPDHNGAQQPRINGVIFAVRHPHTLTCRCIRRFYAVVSRSLYSFTCGEHRGGPGGGSLGWCAWRHCGCRSAAYRADLPIRRKIVYAPDAVATPNTLIYARTRIRLDGCKSFSH